MNIAVCIKQVYDTESRLVIENDTVSVNNPKWIINPYDEFAIEEAVCAKEHFNSKTTLFCLGDNDTTSSIRTALAMGIDNAVSIDSNETIVDSYLIAKALSNALKKYGPFDLIFLGSLSIDNNQSSVGSMLGAFFDIPTAVHVSGIEYSDKITAHTDIEGGLKSKIEIKLPCIITTTKGLNIPRYPKLPNIMKAKQKPIDKISLEDLKIDISDSMLEFSNFTFPPKREKVKMLKGSTDQMVEELVNLLRDEAKVI